MQAIFQPPFVGSSSDEGMEEEVVTAAAAEIMLTLKPGANNPSIETNAEVTASPLSEKSPQLLETLSLFPMN